MRPCLLVAALLCTGLAHAAERPPTEIATTLSFPAHLPLPGDPPRHLARVRIESVQWLQAEGHGRLSVRTVFSQPVEGAGVEDQRDGALRALDDSGLAFVLAPPSGALEAAADAKELAVSLLADLPGTAQGLRILVGSPAQPDGAFSVDLARRSAAAIAPPRDLPALSWAALEKITAPLLAGTPIASRVKVDLSPFSHGGPGHECLRDVEMAIPAMRVSSQGDKAILGVVRVFANHGRKAACEVPRGLWFVSETGDVSQPPAYLVAALPFATYLDAVSFELPAGAERGQLFVGERSPGAETTIVAQIRVDLAARQAQRVEDVEVRIVDAVDGAPVADATLVLRGKAEWRQDRELVLPGRTDKDGRFLYERVEQGAWSLEVVADRYDDAKRSLKHKAERERLEVRLSTPLPKPGLIGVVLMNRKDGVVVREVLRHSGAERAGLRPNDLIVSVEGVRMKSIEQTTLIRGAPGTVVHLEVRREGAMLRVQAQRTPAAR